jgi:hypothetical protein
VCVEEGTVVPKCRPVVSIHVRVYNLMFAAPINQNTRKTEKMSEVVNFTPKHVSTRITQTFVRLELFAISLVLVRLNMKRKVDHK